MASGELNNPEKNQVGYLRNFTCAELRHADVIKKIKRSQVALFSVNLVQLFPKYEQEFKGESADEWQTQQ